MIYLPQKWRLKDPGPGNFGLTLNYPRVNLCERAHGGKMATLQLEWKDQTSPFSWTIFQELRQTGFDFLKATEAYTILGFKNWTN
jgi:hypothetical protein